MNTIIDQGPSDRARFVREQMPSSGLFAGQEWNISPDPFPLTEKLAKDLEFLGRILLQFNRAVNLLYRQSVAGKQPAWIAQWLELGKPQEQIALQRSPALKNDLPRVIRPDLLLTDHDIAITELDSVPGGIGLTGWLNQTYSRFSLPSSVIGGADGMLQGFAGIFGNSSNVHIIVSEESKTYRPEMLWVCEQLNGGNGNRFAVRDTTFTQLTEGDAAYRFFELFDVQNVSNARELFSLAQERKIRLTPPPKTFFEEKMLFALLWNRNLRGFWHQELGQRFFERLLQVVPYTWVVDPAPLPPQGAIPELNITEWQQLKTLSLREREMILKVSGYSDLAWGSRGVYLGSDLSVAEWSEAVDLALRCFERSPFVLQRYHKPKMIDSQWFDFEQNKVVNMQGRVRLCPYYFVVGDGDSARTQLGGVLATICPADKKIIHGMRDAILAPCSSQVQ